jgi:hypothetical protein
LPFLQNARTTILAKYLCSLCLSANPNTPEPHGASEGAILCPRASFTPAVVAWHGALPCRQRPHLGDPALDVAVFADRHLRLVGRDEDGASERSATVMRSPAT